MMKKETGNRDYKRRLMILPFALVFCIFGAVVFLVSRRISSEMSASAINNLSDSLDLVSSAVETVFNKDAEYQKMIAREIANAQDPIDFTLSYGKNDTMVKLSLILSGEKAGVSNTGEAFTEDELDFSAGSSVEGLPVSRSYVNSMGTWAYTMKCPVMRDSEEIAVLYIEYIYDTIGEALPSGFYRNEAKLYLMDASSERLVLKPKGIGERDAGHLNLEDFYHANKIEEEQIHTTVAESIKAGKDVMFYHDILNEESLIYMWAVNDGALYLIGYVPTRAIQQEGTAVNQNIAVVILTMTAAVLSCVVLYLLFDRQHRKVMKERELERERHNGQLKEALQAAQIANQSKTMFLSNMSHDIRTPMNAILGFAALLAKDADDPARVREYTRKITASGQHLLSLINDVLDISKIESGKVVLTIGEFSLNDMLASIDAIIRPAAKEKNQSFEISVTGIRHERLIGDETRLNQILINLLSNAVKYTQEGGNIWLRIAGLERRSAQYEHIRIEVEDNGFGMTPEYLETIFDAFTRAENSTTNKVQGTGLGMAITKNIVELMGGTIEVSSKEGEGSRFRVELELRLPKDEKDEHFWKQKGISRILMADDDADIRETVRPLLEDMGLQVDMARSGEEALELRKNAHASGADYHMILLDWDMPGMNGVETARGLRTEETEHVPILLLTSYDWDEIHDEAVKAGIDGFLTKPFFVSAFKEKVIEMLDGRDEGGKSPAAETESGLSGMRFLVAEDNEINSEILSELLLIEDASCEIVENGKLAVERFEQAPPESFDAILMDVQMPVMNGYEASRAIRALEREDAGAIPIIAMTANAFAEDVKDALDAGMDAHVAKPIDMELLKRTIHQCLWKAGTADSERKTV